MTGQGPCSWTKLWQPGRKRYHHSGTSTMEVAQAGTAAQGGGEDERWAKLRRELEGIKQRPVSRSHPRNWLFRVKRAADFVGHAKPHHATAKQRP